MTVHPRWVGVLSPGAGCDALGQSERLWCAQGAVGGGTQHVWLRAELWGVARGSQLALTLPAPCRR